MLMSPEYYNKEKYSKTRSSVIRAIKDRKRVEMEYLDAVKKQMWYWKTQMDATDPQEDRGRYDELKKNIESEEAHIKQVQDELNRINEELKQKMKK
jgi:hypothetical protein